MACKHKTRWFHLLTAGLLGLLAFLLGESYVRLKTDWVTPETLRRDSLTYVNSHFARHMFPAEAKASGGGGHHWAINSRGYRGPEFLVPKPPGTFRILIYGGSQVFDAAAMRDQSWPHRVGARLQALGFSNVETINAGIPGHASFDSFGRYYAEGHQFEPDMALFCNGWNDIKLLTQEGTLLRAFSRPYIPERDLRIHYVNALDRLLSESSQLYVQLRDRYVLWRQQRGREGRFPQERPPSGIHADFIQQFRVTAGLFTDLARRTGAIPILILQPRLAAPGIPASTAARINLRYAGMDLPTVVTAFARMDRILRETAAEGAAEVVDASGRISGRSPLFSDHIHLTREGGEIMARVVADGIADILTRRGLAQRAGWTEGGAATLH